MSSINPLELLAMIAVVLLVGAMVEGVVLHIREQDNDRDDDKN